MVAMEFVRRLKESRISQISLAVMFLTSGLTINVMQGLLYWGLRPFSKYLYRKIAYYINYSLYCQLLFVAQYWADIKLRLKVKKSDFDRHFGKEHGYLIMNHTYEIDWLVGWILCDNVGVLGNCKSYAKKSIQYLPTLGWAWKFSESIFLDRNWEKDKQIIKDHVNELVNYPDPMWLLLTAEGTRFTEVKYKLSKEFAKRNGFPILKHHLTPRTKGFTFSLPHLRKKVNAIYNVILAINPNGVEPTMKNILLGKTIEANMYVERIPMNDVPEDETSSANWLHELYEKKDRMLDNFFRTGAWMEEQNDEFVSFVLPRRIYPLINTLVWAVLTLPIIGYYMYRFLLSGRIISFLIGCGAIASIGFFFQNLVGQTQISKASSYGAQ